MKTFGEFLQFMETTLDVDLPDNSEDNTDILMRACQKACENHHEQVIAFLQRLAKQDPDIQIELDKFNHQQQAAKPKFDKIRLGGKNGEDAQGRGDVIVPSIPDSANSEAM